MRNVWKVKATEGIEKDFERVCKKHNIFYKAYPEPIARTYRVECPLEALKDIEFANTIQSIEEMPIVTLS